jgi:DNA-binding NarL/FixJ family response regulator
MFTAASDDEQLALRAIEAGCSGFLAKESGIDELLAAVRAAYAGKMHMTPSMVARLFPRLQRGYHVLGSDLSKREREVLQLIAEGASNKVIAERLVISLNTARTHVQNVIAKLHVHSKLEAMVVAAREGLVSRT